MFCLDQAPAAILNLWNATALFFDDVWLCHLVPTEETLNVE